MTTSGAATVRFNRDIYEFLGDITDKTLNVTGNEKPWVEVKVTPGEDSDESKLGYNHTVEFVDSKTIQIQLYFEHPEQVSLNPEEEPLTVSLWGPFVA